MQQLSALDALFLYIETEETPMHVGGLVLFEKPPKHRGSFYKRIRAHIESRLHLAPMFTRKLAFMPLDLANPMWIAEENLDLDWHIRSMTLPAPGTQKQLEAAVATLHEGTLDRDRPLWQFTVIEGLQSGEVGFYSKLHHAGLDGQGGVAMAQAVLDVDPRGRPAEALAKRKSTAAPTAGALLGAAFRNSASQYGKLLKAGASALKSVGGMATGLLSSSQAKAQGAPSEQLAGMATLAVQAAKVKSTDTPLQAARKLLPADMKLGPRTPLNVAITGKRGFATTRIPMDETKALAKFFDVKLNDIVLATCAGALRRMYAKDKKILSKAMVGAVPVSLRAAGDTSANNQVSMMLINMGTNVADPAKRVAAIYAASMQAKMLSGSMKGVASTMTSDLPTLGIPWLMSIITPLYKTAVSTNRIPVVANVVISNVPGPPVPLYMAGARMQSNYPVSIVTHGLALNITIQSYAGSLDYGFIAAREQMPKFGDFVKHMQAAHQELMALMMAAASASPVPEASAVKPVTKKPGTKTPAVKKTPAKKPVAKKVGAKKITARATAAPETKKPAAKKVAAKNTTKTTKATAKKPRARKA